MLPPPSLVARGPWLASLVGLGIIYLNGEFWKNAQQLKVECRGEEATVATCAEGAFRTALLAVAIGLSYEIFTAAIVIPSPKSRRSADWLSPELTHIGYTQPDERGYHHVLYMNHPTTPSKVRFNMAHSGIHTSELVMRDLDDVSFWSQRQQGGDEQWFVDISRDDETPPHDNDFTAFDALTLTDILSIHMIDYFADNNVNGSCFLAQYQNKGTLRHGIIKVVPSLTGNGGKDYPVLECGTDLSAFNISIPLF